MLGGEDTMMGAEGAHDWDPCDPMNLIRLAELEDERARVLAGKSLRRPDPVRSETPPPPAEPVCLTVDLVANKRAAETLKVIASDTEADDDKDARPSKSERRAKRSRRLDYAEILDTNLPMPDSAPGRSQERARLTTDRAYAGQLEKNAREAHQNLLDMRPIPTRAEDFTRPCSLVEWHAKVRCREQLARLEGALLAYTRNNAAWVRSMTGVGNADGFAPGHPCEGLPDATRLTLAKLDALDPETYIKSIEERFVFSLNTSLRLATTVPLRDSDAMIALQCATVLPTLDPGHLHMYMNQPSDGPWRVTESPLVDIGEGESASAPRALHATTTDLAVAARHPSLLKVMCEPLARLAYPTLVALDAIGDVITRRSRGQEGVPAPSITWWRSVARVAPFLAALIARLSCLPLPTLEDLGETGEWWLGAEGESLQERSIRHHTARTQMCITLAQQAAASLELPAARDIRGADGLGRLCLDVSYIVKLWFGARLVNLPTLYTLYASWTAYMFSPRYAALEYTPMSFTNRHLDANSPSVARIRDQLKATHGRKRGNKLADAKFRHHTSNNLAMNIWHEQWEYSTAVKGSSRLKTLLPRDFRFSVWSPHLGDPRAGDRLITSEAITVATFFRAYYWHGSRAPTASFITAGPVAPAVAVSVREAIQLGGHLFYPPDVYTEALNEFIDYCLDPTSYYFRASSIAKRTLSPLEKRALEEVRTPPASSIAPRKLQILHGCKAQFEQMFEARPVKEVGRMDASSFTLVQATELACEAYLKDPDNVARIKRLPGTRMPTAASAAFALRREYAGTYTSSRSTTHVFFRRVKEH